LKKTLTVPLNWVYVKLPKSEEGVERSKNLKAKISPGSSQDPEN
jgi:hypothetical protein